MVETIRECQSEKSKRANTLNENCAAIKKEEGNVYALISEWVNLKSKYLLNNIARSLHK